MVGKNEQAGDSDDSVDRIKLIADRRKSLELNAAQVQEEIRNCFAQLAEALMVRERQLLRQVEAIHTQQLSLIHSNLEFLPPAIVNLNDRHDLEEQIQNFGKIELSGTNCIAVKDVEPYKVQDYQEADKDHVSFNKSIKHDLVMEKQLKVIPDKEENQDKGNSMYDKIIDSSLCSNIMNDMHIAQKVSYPGNVSECTNHSDALPSCSPSLVIKQKLNLNHLLKQDTQDPKIKCSNDVANAIEGFVRETMRNNIQNDSENDCDNRIKIIETELNETIDLCDQHDKEHEKNDENSRDSYEHPKQIQQWLQQILVETEIEPVIHEIGQFSEISQVQTYNNFQLET